MRIRTKGPQLLKRKIEITVEQQRLILSTHRRVSVTAWCGACRLGTTFVTPDEAARLAGLPAREIYRKVEAAEVHFIEPDDGELLVCCNSL